MICSILQLYLLHILALIFGLVILFVSGRDNVCDDEDPKDKNISKVNLTFVFLCILYMIPIISKKPTGYNKVALLVFF
jgi:hypothetical protein